MKKKIILIAISFSIPIILISSIMLYLVQGPIKRKFLADHSQNFTQETQFINSTLEQLELYIANWGGGLRDQFLMDYPLSISNFQEINSISERIFLLENISPLIDSATLAVFNDSPYYLSSSGTWSLSAQSSFPSFEELANGSEFQWIPHNHDDEVKLYFVHNLRLNDEGGSIFLLAEINLEKVSQLLKISTDLSQNFNAYYINNQLIAYSGARSEKMNDILASLDKSLIGNKAFEYQDLSIVTISKEYLKQSWTFVSILPISTLTEPIQSFSIILFVSATLLVITTSFYSYYVSKREYQPVYELMKEIANGEEEWQAFSPSATDYLKGQWLDLQEEKKLLLAKTKDNEKKNKRNAINRIIRGELNYYSEEELLHKMEESGWSQIRNGYHLYSVQLTERITTDSPFNLDLSDFILNNILNDITEKHFDEFTTLRSVSNCVFIFVSHPIPADGIFVEEIFQTVNSILKRYVTVTTNDYSTEIKALPTIYGDLSYNRFFHELKKSNQYLLPTKNKQKIRAAFAYPAHYERMIVDSITTHKQDDLYPLAEKFFQTIISQNNTQAYILEATKQLYNAISYLLLENGLLPSEYISKENLLLQMEMHFEVQSLAKNLYDSLIKPAYDLYLSQTQEGLKKNILSLRDYLDHHFDDPNLSLEQAATQVNIDAHLLSKEFKKYIGMNFIDYITTLRIEHAKHLLINTDLKINYIAEKLGYTGSYFNRLFKKKMGVTPGQYRESKKESTAKDI